MARISDQPRYYKILGENNAALNYYYALIYLFIQIYLGSKICHSLLETVDLQFLVGISETFLSSMSQAQ
jgi:hypothetical protein